MASENKRGGSCNVCKKIYKAVSPFRASSVRRNSHQPTENPTKISSPQTVPVHVLHQNRLSQMIPVEDSDDHREIHVVSGQKVKGEKVASRIKSRKDDEFSDYINKVKKRMVQTMSSVGGGSGGGNGGVVGRSGTRRDSFNDKVTSYINHAKVKIRTTTTVG